MPFNSISYQNKSVLSNLLVYPLNEKIKKTTDADLEKYGS
jgi:hypothetical protein